MLVVAGVYPKRAPEAPKGKSLEEIIREALAERKRISSRARTTFRTFGYTPRS